jgi:hypothetical protein
MAETAVYTGIVQLRTARLCLDCEEIHEDPTCPRCASETFAYLTRWIPAPESSRPSVPEAPPEAAVYRRLLLPESAAPPAPPKTSRLLRQGAIGLTVFSLARWAWRRHKRQTAES